MYNIYFIFYLWYKYYTLIGFITYNCVHISLKLSYIVMLLWFFFIFLQKQEKQSPEKITNLKEDELRPPGDCDEDSINGI